MRFGAIIVAAGSSGRMGEGRNKIFESFGGKTVIRHTLLAFEASALVGSIVLVCRAEDMAAMERECAGIGKSVNVTAGGSSRQESVSRGLEAMRLSGPAKDYCVIHDGARPLITAKLIDSVCRDAVKYGASAAAVPAKDTYKVVDREGFIINTPDRSSLMAVQTPQVFRLEEYGRAIESAIQNKLDFTDDCQAMEHAGVPVHMTPGDYKNIKITTPEDLLMAEAITEASRADVRTSQRSERCAAEAKGGELHREINFRIGQGYDVHRLVRGRRLILCGVEIPYEMGLDGHSDADAAAHALTDAILGAAAMGDIGRHFPDTDPAFKNADSLELLRQTVLKVMERGYFVGNIDITIVAQRPKLMDYIPRMRRNIAKACSVAIDAVSVKATTEEGLGVSGEGKGIAAYAVCFLKGF